MTGRITVNLPLELKKDAEVFAKQHGISLNQFILWSVTEKVSALKAGIDDPNFPGITYRHGASGILVPVLRGTGIRVQTVVIAHREWNESPAEIADQYSLPSGQIKEALTFYQAHQAEVDLLIQSDSMLESSHNS